MTVTREDLIRKLSDKSGYHMKDIRHLLHCMDEVVFEELCKVQPDEEIVIQIVQGAKFSTKVIPLRDRVDPRDGRPIVCKPTVKIACKFSQDMKLKLQEYYDEQHNG